jgi:nitrogenase subunit NifH
MSEMMVIQGAIMSLKAAGDIAKGLFHIKSMTDVQLQAIELQSTILSAQASAIAAQSEQSSMIHRIGELEKEIAEIKAWEETKHRYQLTTPWDGCQRICSERIEQGNGPTALDMCSLL